MAIFESTCALRGRENLLSQRTIDDALRNALAVMFRAGQIEGAVTDMLDLNPHDYDKTSELITSSLAQAQLEAQEDATFNALNICTTLIDLRAYEEARDEFRRDDVEKERWPGSQGRATDDHCDYDFALRRMLAEFFRAGMLAAQRILTQGVHLDAATPKAGSVKAERKDPCS